MPPETPPTPLPAHLDPTNYPRTLTNPTHNIHLELTYTPLDPSHALTHTSSPSAGATVLFLGTTRDSNSGRAVARLSYTAYAPLALKTLHQIATGAAEKYHLQGVYIAHRLGEVPVREASIVVAVSAGHRGGAFEAGREVLEEVKAKVEVWKREEFVDGGMEWRENRDGVR